MSKKSGLYSWALVSLLVACSSVMASEEIVFPNKDVLCLTYHSIVREKGNFEPALESSGVVARGSFDQAGETVITTEFKVRLPNTQFVDILPAIKPSLFFGMIKGETAPRFNFDADIGSTQRLMGGLAGVSTPTKSENETLRPPLPSLGVTEPFSVFIGLVDIVIPANLFESGNPGPIGALIEKSVVCYVY